MVDAAPSNLRERLRLQTRAEIVDAAELVLVQEGLATARIDNIATRAGVSVGTLYNHFADRDALITAVVRRNFERLLSDLGAVVVAPALCAEEAVRRYLQCFERQSELHGRFIALVMSEGPQSQGWMCMRDDLLREVYGVSRAIVDQGIAAGWFKADCRHELAALLPALGRIFLIRLVNPSIGPLSVEALVRLVLHGATCRLAGARGEAQ